MNLKTKIKNDLWRFNYIVPFVKKYRADTKGVLSLAAHTLSAYWAIRPVKGRGKKRTIGNDTKALLSEVKIDIPDKGFVYFLDTGKTIAVPGNIVSNFTIDYKKLIETPFIDLVKEVNGDDDYSTEIRTVAKGIDLFTKRIIKAISTSQLSEDEKNKRSSEFKNMLREPAWSFEEGLQRILFFNQLMWQTRHRLNGLGRLDLYLSELYNHDKENGILTRDEAGLLIDDFLEKISHYSSYKSDALEGDIGQIIILGGLDQKGNYFCNDLTELFMERQAKAKRPDPKVLLRVSKHMPKKLMEKAVDCLQSQTGSPLFSNDDVVIPAMIDGGIELDDAYNYCTSACWEPFIVGKSFDQNNVAVFDYELAFDSLMQQTDITSFDEFVNQYIKLNKREFRKFLQGVDQLKWAKDPLVSLLTENCCELHKDVSAGGAKYSNYGITTVGLPNVIDSLFNIKELVFDKKEYTLRQLKEIRKRNFKGEESLYNWCQKRKYFGKDNQEIVHLTNCITKSLSKLAEQYQNSLGGTVKFGLSSPGYIMLSKRMPADFSGRKIGMPYHTHISGEGLAYTEVINFAGELNYDGQRYNGNVVDYFMNPGFLEQNKEKFVTFMVAAIDVGFFQMQFNIMDSKTLIDAKNNPQKYPGLIVRVWGFSAYFNNLPENYKDLLIKRALETEQLV